MRSIIGALLVLAACDGGGSTGNGECVSGEYWTGGNEESPLMRPGGDCIGCHTDEREGPIYSAAGTISGALDEPDDCNGVQDVIVRITDADDVVHETTTNAAGNFFFREAIPTPYTATIEYDGLTVSMATPQTDGACATCHTESGAGGAVGRIILPE